MAPISAGGHRFLAGARVSAKRTEPHLTSWSGNLTTHRLEERESLGELGGSSVGARWELGERITGRRCHGGVTEVHMMTKVIERFLDGSAFFMAGSLSG